MQKSILDWLKEGDANSKFFHGIITSRRRSNVIISISVHDVQVEGVNGVRKTVFDRFHNHFQSVAVDRPKTEDLSFKLITMEEGSSLTLPFSEVEIKQTVWDCDSFKSPGPYGINLSFIKNFRDVLKDESMRFLLSFTIMAR